jgi:ribonuclease E
VQPVSAENRQSTTDMASPVMAVSEVQAAAPATIIVPAATPVQAPVAVPAVQVASAPAPATRALPQVASYDLPLQDLAQVASASGLQWVNSNTSKIAETQAAMAAEPRPAHVPRERAPVVAVQASPLVLVETKRDLSNMTLPFEDAAPTQGPQ